jgi:GDPmannose 4,6-dehydratase
MGRKALICGVSGQDGAYLSRLLLSKGYDVIGTSRDAQLNSFDNLHQLGIRDEVNTVSMTLTDFRSVLQTLSTHQPDEIYNLAGQSSVGLSFELPVETLESIATASLNLLESVRFLGGESRLYNASSSECFGDVGDSACDEMTPFHPGSPYAVAKAAAHWQVVNYREAYDLYATNGILFNHESPLRPNRFVSKKIIRAAVRIGNGSSERLRLGNLAIQRDFGWAPEYVDAMWRILQLEQPNDVVIATGETHSLNEFCQAAFSTVGLDWQEHVDIDEALYRPSEHMVSRANPSLAEQLLGWRAELKMPAIVSEMINAEKVMNIA